MVGSVVFALTIAKKRKATSAAVRSRRGGKFILSGCTDVVRSHDDHPKTITTTPAAREFGLQQPGGVGGNLRSAAKFGQGFGKSRVGRAVSLDCSGDNFEVGQSLLLVFTDGGPIPLDFERGKIEEEHADREDFPGGFFADKTHQDVMWFAAHRRFGVGGVANVDRQKR